jgi:LruC domain-containing protein
MKVRIKMFSGGIIIILFTIFLFGCKKDDSPNDNDNITNMDDLVADANFNWEMTKTVNITVTALDNQDGPIQGARINIYSDSVNAGGILLLSGITNESGIWETTYPLNANWTTLMITTGYIGLPSETVATIENGAVSVVLGGIQPFPDQKSSPMLKSVDVTGYQYLCNYNSQGVPGCLSPPDDVISNGLLADINAALPERSRVPVDHPEYLAQDNETDIVLLEDADVWVTFVHEGAGYTNALGFYVYDVTNPPANKNAIETIYFAFPNLSYKNSGGGLSAGNKIFLGTFSAGQAIGWVLVANGWNGSAVNTSRTHYYSNPPFNPETNPVHKQHNVSLFDPIRELVVIGFEDLVRPGGDEDFNDALYYVTANPPEAINNSNVPLLDPTIIDTDGDGVYDLVDDYPLDPDRAFNNYYPGENLDGSFAFEDLWPSKGDYDFNDLVLLYNFNQITNGQNRVVDIIGEFTVQAVGAGYKNGFGFQLPVLPEAVSQVSGFSIEEDFINLAANNVEVGQDKATIIVFDNTYNLFEGIGSGYINTTDDKPYVEPESITVTINFATPQTVAQLGVPPYNPFIIVNKERGREVHLPGYPPTALVNTSYFGTEDDDSNIALGRYYKSVTNLPWAMNLPVAFSYPVEKEPIVKAHLVFDTWVKSSGFSYMDWYENKFGYRDTEKIYLP